MSTVWDSVQLARHAKRPLFMDYVNQLFTEFDELHGDRAYADDKAILGGLARFDGQPVMVIGQHRGRSTVSVLLIILVWQTLKAIAKSFDWSKWLSALTFRS